MPAPPPRAVDHDKRHRDGGFSLVEIIVSFAIFAVLATAVASIAVGSLRTAGDNRERVRAATLAAEKVERVRAEFRRSPTGALAICAGLPEVPEGAQEYTLRCTSRWVNAAGTTVNAATSGAVLLVEVKASWPGLRAGRPPVINTTVLS